MEARWAERGPQGHFSSEPSSEAGLCVCVFPSPRPQIPPNLANGNSAFQLFSYRKMFSFEEMIKKQKPIYQDTGYILKNTHSLSAWFDEFSHTEPIWWSALRSGNRTWFPLQKTPEGGSIFRAKAEDQRIGRWIGTFICAMEEPKFLKEMSVCVSALFWNLSFVNSFEALMAKEQFSWHFEIKVGIIIVLDRLLLLFLSSNQTPVWSLTSVCSMSPQPKWSWSGRIQIMFLTIPTTWTYSPSTALTGHTALTKRSLSRTWFQAPYITSRSFQKWTTSWGILTSLHSTQVSLLGCLVKDYSPRLSPGGWVGSVG